MVYRITVDGKRKSAEASIKEYSLEADNRAREEIIRHYLDDEGAKDVTIETTPEEVRRYCKEGISTIVAGTGFDELDNLMGGLQEGQVIMVAGRPSMGKRTFAMNMVGNCCLNCGKGVYVNSLDMPKGTYTKHLIELCGNINSGLIIDDTVCIGSHYEYFCDTLHRLKEEDKVSLAIIDYIQLMDCNYRAKSRNEEMLFIMTGLKRLAQELRIPIIVLSQLGRACEMRKDHHPVLSDTGIRSDWSDIVLLLYRDGYYNNDGSGDKGMDTEVIIAKHPVLSGIPVTLHLNYNPKRGGFR